MTHADLASRAGFSESAVRGYLTFLAVGDVTFGLRYGAAGRPEYLYRWGVHPR